MAVSSEQLAWIPEYRVCIHDVCCQHLTAPTRLASVRFSYVVRIKIQM